MWDSSFYVSFEAQALAAEREQAQLAKTMGAVRGEAVAFVQETCAGDLRVRFMGLRSLVTGRALTQGATAERKAHASASEVAA